MCDSLLSIFKTMNIVYSTFGRVREIDVQVYFVGYIPHQLFLRRQSRVMYAMSRSVNEWWRTRGVRKERTWYGSCVNRSVASTFLSIDSDMSMTRKMLVIKSRVPQLKIYRRIDRNRMFLRISNLPTSSSSIDRLHRVSRPRWGQVSSIYGGFDTRAPDAEYASDKTRGISPWCVARKYASPFRPGKVGVTLSLVSEK